MGNPVGYFDPSGNFRIGSILKGSMLTYIGYVGIGTGVAALTVATGVQH